MAVSLAVFFLLGFMYFVLFANAFFNEIARQNNNADIESAQDESCVNESDFDISDPYITKSPNWNKK